MKKLNITNVIKFGALTCFVLAFSACNNAAFKGKNVERSKESSQETTDQNEEDLKIGAMAKFSLLVNDLRCAFCHVTVNGDVISTSPVNDWSGQHAAGSNEIVNGRWLAAQDWIDTADNGQKYKINVVGGVQKNYAGLELPKDLDKDGRPDFPLIDFANLKTKMKGTVESKSNNVMVVDSHEANLILIGTIEHPIKLSGEIFVNGDLVIKGYYQGVGAIYVSGNIYVPFDLRAKNSIFPYPVNVEEAKAKAQAALENASTDAIGLASGKSILIADLDASLYDSNVAPVNRRRAALEVNHVYTWYPGGKAEYVKLYESAYNCTNGNSVKASFNMVEAFLYAKNTIGGRAPSGSWVINGGMIADNMHIIGRAGFVNGAPACQNLDHPVHKLNMQRNYINFDYRMSFGLPILNQLNSYFQY